MATSKPRSPFGPGLALALSWLLLLAQPSLLAQEASDTYSEAEEEYSQFDELYGDAPGSPTPDVPDPFRPVNRAIFNFNDFVYLNLLKPVSQGYQAITPDPVEKGISNVFDNANYPVRLTGNLLQFRLEGAIRETGKFVVNSTVGLGGFFKASDDFDHLNPPEEDVAQAFASWGIGNGFYFVMPFTGPTTLRDAIGGFGDRAVHPISRPWSLIDDDPTRYILEASELISDSPSLLGGYESLKDSAIDPYESFKSAYLQMREDKLKE